MSRIHHHTTLIKEKARQLGFNFCGISKAAFLEEEARPLDTWLNKQYHGTMGYMERNHDMRLDPRLLVPDAKSVISLIYNYYPQKDFAKKGRPKLAKYAYGKDYHFVIKKKIKALLLHIQKEIGQVEGRAFVDSAPILERPWARKSGLGWIGKNSLLLNRQLGSFFFIAELIVDLSLSYDGPTKDYCGSCTACIDSCPTDAIVEPSVIDSNKCVSYLTIELKDAIPSSKQSTWNDWVFGCDICQDVCPWNRFAKPNEEIDFEPHPFLEEMNWKEMTQETFGKVFKKSSVKRAGFKKLKDNVLFVTLSTA